MLWILDNGHGIDTRGKRSPQSPPGIHEWEFNRSIVDRVIDLSRPHGLETYNLAPNDKSMTLRNRIHTTNMINRNTKGGTRLISVHANAGRDPGWSSAEGCVVYISVDASSTSKALAETLLACMRKCSSISIARGIKTSKLQMVHRTHCPAVLLECGFMTSLSDCYTLASDDGQHGIAKAIVMAMYQTQYGL